MWKLGRSWVGFWRVSGATGMNVECNGRFWSGFRGPSAMVLEVMYAGVDCCGCAHVMDWELGTGQ